VLEDPASSPPSWHGSPLGSPPPPWSSKSSMSTEGTRPIRTTAGRRWF